LTDSITTRAAAPDFVSLFGAEPTHRAEAPGRVNLIGDHTDYNGGFVLPMPMPQRTNVELRLRNDGMVHLWSASVEEPGALYTYRLGSESKKQHWTDYVQGVTWALRADGRALSGFDLRIESTVPIGAGLSSSARGRGPGDLGAPGGNRVRRSPGRNHGPYGLFARQAA
jgi:galactokinase